MRVIHLLRKYDPAEWGGTETAVGQLLDRLRQHEVTPVLYCPRLRGATKENGAGVKRFGACVPVLGISSQQKRQHVAVGGNLMSFDLLPALWREQDVALIHTHTLGRLGGIASAVARGRGLPFVVSIHGGLMDPPPAVKENGSGPSWNGFEWGKIFGFLLQSRRLIEHSDAVFACNHTEAELLRNKHPEKRIEVQPHGIDTVAYREDRRDAARKAFPQILGRDALLCVGRIDPVKNQEWLVAEAPEIFRNHPNALLVLAGACTNDAYGRSIERQIHRLGLENRVLLTGGLPPGDPRLIGLFQEARAVILSSFSETFGLVLLEAWAAGTTVIASRTSGASALVREGENGWLFDLTNPRAFHQAVGRALDNTSLRARLVESGRQLVNGEYDLNAVARRVKCLYEELIESKHALRTAA